MHVDSPPVAKTRRPTTAMWFVVGVGLGALACGFLWLAHEQTERAQAVALSTFEFPPPASVFVWSQILVLGAGAAIGAILLLAFRGEPGSRIVLLLGGVVAPMFLVAAFWSFTYGWGLPWSVVRRFDWAFDGDVLSPVILAIGILLTVAIWQVVKTRQTPG